MTFTLRSFSGAKSVNKIVKLEIFHRFSIYRNYNKIGRAAIVTLFFFCICSTIDISVYRIKNLKSIWFIVYV